MGGTQLDDDILDSLVDSSVGERGGPLTSEEAATLRDWAVGAAVGGDLLFLALDGLVTLMVRDGGVGPHEITRKGLEYLRRHRRRRGLRG